MRPRPNQGGSWCGGLRLPFIFILAVLIIAFIAMESDEERFGRMTQRWIFYENDDAPPPKVHVFNVTVPPSPTLPPTLAPTLPSPPPTPLPTLPPTNVTRLRTT